MKFNLIILACLVSTAAAMATLNYKATSCGSSSYYGPYGVITSPNHSGNYDGSLYCDEFIYASTGSSLSLIFNSFNTEQCCDYVTISCRTNSSFPEQRFSGSSLPDPVSIPWCSQGLVNFQTDSSPLTVYSGFSLDYYFSEGGCGNTVYTDAFGFVTTPNYPNPYGLNQNCSNIIWAPQQSTFYLQFHNFSLETNCNRDWLEISCLEGAAFGPSRYCGYKPYTTMYIYECSRLLLWFHSDNTTSAYSNTTYSGFNIEYNVYPESGGNTDFESTYPTYPTTSTPRPAETGYTGGSHPPTATMDQACGDSSYYGSYGVISSPNYPGYYDNNLYCDYYVYAEAGSSLSFIFNSIHVESGDFVTISCPSNWNFPPQEYSGHTIPEAFSISPCSQGKVNFRTDYTTISSGFSLDYYVSDAGCGTTVYTGSSGLVNSPNWPEFYGYNTNCSNIIWAPHQSTIQLNFRTFVLPNDCNADWLEISCLDNSEYSPKRLCGNYDDKYEIYIQQCSQLLLWFHSDGSINAQGFVIEYTIYPIEACGGLSYFGPSGNISSPNYPGNYYDFLYCDYTIYASLGNSLLFAFESFHLEEGYDFMTISCPANSSYYEYEYTGDRYDSPLSIPNCSQGLVNFHTDDTVVSSGFRLKYFVNTAGCANGIYYAENGYVTSPNWPSTYGYNQDCYSVIYSYWEKEQTTFYLNFQFFILHSCCSCDWLEISCVDNPELSPVRYCGSYPAYETYISNCRQVVLWFHSDGSGNDQGFNIEYTVSASAGGVLNNGTLNTIRHDVPRKGPVKAARKAPKNKNLNAAHHVPTYGKPLAAENDHGNEKPLASQHVPSNGRPLAGEHVPINEKPLAEQQNAHSYGKPLSAQLVPGNGRPLAAENVPRSGKPIPAENVPSNGRPLAVENAPSNGKPNAEEKMKTK